MLTVESHERGGVVVLDLKGAIDGGPSSYKFHEVLKEHLASGRKRLVLNVHEVTWVNSLGSGILFAAVASAARGGATVKLANASRRVCALLEACGLVPEVLEVLPGETEAVESFS